VDPGPVPTFEDRLLVELGELAAAKYVADRAARLQEVTAALAKATTVEHVADVVLAEGTVVLGASGGGLLTGSAAGDLRLVRSVGYDAAFLGMMLGEPVDLPLPSRAVVTTREAVWIESPQERDTLFARLGQLDPTAVAMCAVPLLLGDDLVGVLRFSFTSPRLFDADERRFIEALAAQAAQALVRASLYGAERAARFAAEDIAERLARLQVATAAFGAATSLTEIADLVVNHAADALGAEYASLWLLRDDVLHVVGSRGLDEETQRRWSTLSMSSRTPLGEAVRIDDVVVVHPEDDVARLYPDVAGEPRPEDPRVFVSVPLTVAGSRVGAISLSFPVQYDLRDRTSLRFLRTLADACGQAIVRTRAQEDVRIAGERLSFLADASAVLASSLDYRATLATIADLVVPRVADWCSIQVLEGNAFSTVAVAHVDPQKVSAAREFQRRYPTDPDATTGVSQVVRSGRSELVPEVTAAMMDAAAGVLDREQIEFVKRLGLSSIMTVPLTGRTGTFGALSLIYAESGRHYDEGDRAFIEDLARRCAVAVENAEAYSTQSSQLLRVSRVAEVTQHAILPPVPPRIGPVRLATRYVSATREALIGGDLYEVAEHEGTVRLIVGDVRGKGVDAVRLATVVLGEFRSSAARFDDVATMAAHMDQRLRSYFGDEDFVTALLAEIAPDGSCDIVSCGHPRPYLALGDELSLIEAPPGLPLGLGATPVAHRVRLAPGSRILMHTDGLVEARTQDGGFVDADSIVAPLGRAPFEDVLDAILERLQVAARAGVADDLALLLAEYAPE
jgi:GAF domain-containing protein